MTRKPAQASKSAPDPAMTDPESARRLSRLPWRTYRMRILGMGLGALPLMAVMSEIGSSWWAWSWMLLSCLVWPHLAFAIATRSRDPFRAERRNFMIDSAIAGSWVPLMHFNLLPSAVLLTVVTADKINTGVRGLWLRSLPGMLAMIVLGGLMTGFSLHFESSTRVILASLPILMIHTLAVSASGYRLVRKLQRQNLQLDEINRADALTGLDSRSHWLAQADALLTQHQQQGRPAALLMLDLDRFKEINDRHGHGTGDDVLRAVSDRIRQLVGDEGHAGRLGGDEFAIALRMGPNAATAFAETLRAGVEALRFARLTSLRCSVSLGLAEPPDAGLGLREWMEAADRALYLAKHRGRNRTVGHDVSSGPPHAD